MLTSQAENGIATFDGVAPQSAGNYTLQATDGTDTPASASFSVTPAAVSSLTFMQQPTDVVAGQAIAPAVVVQAKDQYGNVISGDAVTLAVENYPSGTLYGSFMATTDGSGNATFDSISLPTAGSYMLVATDGTVSTGNSNSFVVSAAVAAMLVFAQQPSNVPAGTAISPNVVVDVEDQFGDLVTTDNSNVILSLNSGDGSLNGTLTVQAQNGVATFSDLSLNGAGIYTIGAGDGALATTSAAFTIYQATPAVTLASPPPSITYDGTSDVTNWAIPSVSGVSGVANPTGSPNVVFYAGISPAGTPLASAPVYAGTYTAVAGYFGDANYGASQSVPVTFAIRKATPTVIATDAVNPSVFGQSVTFTATVTPQFSGTPTGTVTFTDGSTQLAKAVLSGGVATYTTTALTAATHTITATYGGDSNFTGSSGSLGQLYGIISTYAGGGVDDGDAATAASINNPGSVAVDTAGNVYIADSDHNRIRKVSASTGIITTIAGNGSLGYSGDGGAATAAGLYYPYGVAVDAAGNLYIADTGDNRIRKVSASTGIITTVAGNGSAGYSGDGAAATAAELDKPFGVAVDAAGNLYIADTCDNRIREVSASTGIITTVAGNGSPYYGGDGGAATAAGLAFPEGVAVDAAGNLYIADSYDNRIRKVSASTGIITTVAGNGSPATTAATAGLATAAGLYNPYGVAVDAAGNLYIADTWRQSHPQGVGEHGDHHHRRRQRLCRL